MAPGLCDIKPANSAMVYLMSLNKELKYFVLLRLLLPVMYLVLRIYAGTLRLKIEDSAQLVSGIEKGKKAVLASWHQRFFGGFFLPRALGMTPCIMISRSRDGDFIANVVSRIGWLPVRGSSSRGGREALREMVAGVMKNKLGGHIVDGPTGPPRVIKPGLIALAQQAGASICPTYVSYEDAWVFNSWDRFMVPKPFSGVLLRFAEMIDVPQDLDEKAFEEFRRYVEQKMIEGYDEADSYWEGQRKTPMTYACYPIE